MRLTKISIRQYRSIDQIDLTLPDKQPLILFGPNNAGKSNILSAIDRIIGERYPTYIEMLDSDYFMRDKNQYPQCEIIATFSEPVKFDRYKGAIYQIGVRYAPESENGGGPLLHDGSGNKLYLSNEERSKCQGYLIDAERNIQGAFNYGSRYSLLSKFSHQIHKALSSEHKEELTATFIKIKELFEQTSEYSSFFGRFADALQGSVKGFVHSLAVDFSAYDPNNFAKSLRIYAKEGEEIRGFEEFGTGEQQILLMAFVKAYMQTFGSENIILLIEEPEAHLHPLAQKWLKEYIVEMCKNGIQIVISTHSPDFVDPSYLSGLVRVYKEGSITHAVQISKQVLRDFCVASGVPENRITVDSIDDFYSTKLNSDHLKGLFAETVLLVEGATEYFALPCFMKQAGFSLSEHGIEIVACGGKETIPLLWRLFKAYKYNCYFIFDSDSKQDENTKTFNGIIDCDTWISDPQSYVLTNRYAYFGKDFEHYFRSAIPEYNELENEASESYGITSKPGKARSVAQHCSVIPSFITELVQELETIEMLGQNAEPLGI